MNRRFIFEAEPFRADYEFDEFIDASGEYDEAFEFFDPELQESGFNEATSEDVRLYKYHPPTAKRKYGGFTRYGGGRVDARLKELRQRGRLPISDAEIDMLQRIANVESSGLIQGINSYDSAFMSMGFMQWTIKFMDNQNPDGKLQRLIRRAPTAFRKYGIELDISRRYIIGEYRPIAIKGARTASALRSLDWAKKFYAAGLDPEIIIAEVKLAREVIAESKQRIVNKVGRDFLPYYERSAILRALIQETFNNRPVYLYLALKSATTRAKSIAGVDTERFLQLVRAAIMEVYREKEPEDGAKKARNLIDRTARLVL